MNWIRFSTRYLALICLSLSVSEESSPTVSLVVPSSVSPEDPLPTTPTGARITTLTRIAEYNITPSFHPLTQLVGAPIAMGTKTQCVVRVIHSASVIRSWLLGARLLKAPIHLSSRHSCRGVVRSPRLQKGPMTSETLSSPSSAIPSSPATVPEVILQISPLRASVAGMGGHDILTSYHHLLSPGSLRSQIFFIFSISLSVLHPSHLSFRLCLSPPTH
jgi:hypothetical protein